MEIVFEDMVLFSEFQSIIIAVEGKTSFPNLKLSNIELFEIEMLWLAFKLMLLRSIDWIKLPVILPIDVQEIFKPCVLFVRVLFSIVMFEPLLIYIPTVEMFDTVVLIIELLVAKRKFMPVSNLVMDMF